MFIINIMLKVINYHCELQYPKVQQMFKLQWEEYPTNLLTIHKI